VFIEERERGGPPRIAQPPAPRSAFPAATRLSLPATPDLRAARQAARDLRTAARRAGQAVDNPPIRIARLIRFIVFVLLVWWGAQWLMAIPEVVALKNAVQAGQMSDEDVKGAIDAVRARINAALGNAPAPTR
jgi:hypothetical protein